MNKIVPDERTDSKHEKMNKSRNLMKNERRKIWNNDRTAYQSVMILNEIWFVHAFC